MIPPLMAEIEEELKSLLMKAKVESEKVGLKAQHSENEGHSIRSQHFMGNRWELMPIDSVMPSNHLILCHHLLFLPSVFPSTRVFSNESILCIRWPKYWSFSFSINPSNEYSWLTSFRVDWFDHPAVLGTLKSLLQHCSLKASIPWSSVSLWSSSHIHTDYWENHSFE